jgi:hypothetical protein
VLSIGSNDYDIDPTMVDDDDDVERFVEAISDGRR